MGEIIVGSEALAAGALTRHDLRRRYVKLHHNVYAPVRMALTPRDRACGLAVVGAKRHVDGAVGGGDARFPVAAA